MLTATTTIRHTEDPLERAHAHLLESVLRAIPADGLCETGIPGLRLYRRSEPTACASAHYEPELIFFIQGEKRIELGTRELTCDSKHFLLTSIDLPVSSQVTQATAEHPILGLILRLDMPLIREILAQEDFLSSTLGSGSPRGMTVGRSTLELTDAFQRLLNLTGTPEHIPFLSSLIQREILYRLLRGPEGRHLRAIATLGEQSNRTARAVAWLRDNFSKPLRVEDLASMAQMGVSTFHHHFRTLTAMSPLQYQKQLRLHVAREKMLNSGLDATSAAFEVGYESPSQFNREYRRFFGQPPMRDVKARKSSNEFAMAE